MQLQEENLGQAVIGTKCLVQRFETWHPKLYHLCDHTFLPPCRVHAGEVLCEAVLYFHQLLVKSSGVYFRKNREVK